MAQTLCVSSGASIGANGRDRSLGDSIRTAERETRCRVEQRDGVRGGRGTNERVRMDYI